MGKLVLDRMIAPAALIRTTEDQLLDFLEKTRAGNETSPVEIRIFKHLDL